ncbi:MAG: tyrosine-type recombinase/integrase [Thermoguttaceae bacterium]
MPKRVEAKKRNFRFTNKDGVRRNVYLGMLPDYEHEVCKRNLDKLVHSYQLGSPIMDLSLSTWLQGIDDDLHAKIAKAGLCEGKGQALLGLLTAEFIEKHRGGKEPGTLDMWGQDRNRLLGFFGEAKPVPSITRADCEVYKTWLYDEKGYADSTVGRAIRNAKMFFGYWVRTGLLSWNPFEGVKSSNEIDESRNHYIPVETVNLAMEYCPDAEWRAIFGLARFAGLRPGEILVLKLNDIKWDRNRIIVPSPKTKRYKGGGQREIPLFPSLRTILYDVCEQAEVGAVYVLDRLRRRSVGLKNGHKPNLGKIVNDIFERAGIPRWTKPFVSMRGSCETDLAEKYPIQTVTAWIGNSPAVAQKHYLRVLPEHFERALREEESPDREKKIGQPQVKPSWSELPKELPIGKKRGGIEDIGNKQVLQNTPCGVLNTTENTDYCTETTRQGLEP